MSQYLSQSLGQHMRLEQRLTPQLIQSMAILQKPVAELETYVNDALESNAALDIAEPRQDPSDRDAENDHDGRNRDTRRDDEAGFARLDRYFRDHHLESAERAPYMARRFSSGERDAKMGALANTAGREISLQEHLLGQWKMLDLDDEVHRAGEAAIDQIDPDGYLRVPWEHVADSVRPPLQRAHLERALSEIYKLDPIGVGARNVVECLLLQLDALPGDNQVERTLIAHHLHDITHNRLPAIARATGYSLGEITEAIQVMRSALHLHPGYLVGDRSVPPIRPDVIVEYAESGGGFHVRLTRGNVPDLCIRPELLEMAKTKGKNVAEGREFARKQVEAAAAIIDAVQFRQSRLMQVSAAIVEKQREFFDVGPSGLKVFRMSDLAGELNCDPSTISRTVADKYMQTPRGIFPLRYFFTGGTETQDGESMGWDRVKTRVREIVDREDRTKPLSDDQIAILLKQEGIEISRRTVTKYRQQLNIPAARQRKRF